jgi:hypothetical protein
MSDRDIDRGNSQLHRNGNDRDYCHRHCRRRRSAKAKRNRPRELLPDDGYGHDAGAIEECSRVLRRTCNGVMVESRDASGFAQIPEWAATHRRVGGRNVVRDGRRRVKFVVEYGHVDISVDVSSSVFGRSHTCRTRQSRARCGRRNAPAYRWQMLRGFAGIIICPPRAR